MQDNKNTPVYIATDIETKIDTYVDWFFDECNDPRDELIYLMKYKREYFYCLA